MKEYKSIRISPEVYKKILEIKRKTGASIKYIVGKAIEMLSK